MGCTDSRTPEPVPTPQQENVVIVVQNDRHPLGLKFSIRSGRLLVRHIQDGAIAEWNARNPGRQVCTGSQIACVNGESGSLSKMLTQLHMVGQIQIHFRDLTQAAAPCGRHSRSCSHRATGSTDEAQQPFGACSRGTQLVELPFVSAANLVDATCCICLEAMDPEIRVMELPCKHHFHLECAAQWLSRKGACPLCARPLVPERDDDEAAHAVPSELEAEPSRTSCPSARRPPPPPAAARPTMLPSTGQFAALGEPEKQTI